MSIIFCFLWTLTKQKIVQIQKLLTAEEEIKQYSFILKPNHAFIHSTY